MFFFSDLSAPKSTRYKFAGQMRGHIDSIHTLAMNRDGGLLASGGKQNATAIRSLIAYSELRRS